MTLGRKADDTCVVKCCLPVLWYSFAAFVGFFFFFFTLDNTKCNRLGVFKLGGCEPPLLPPESCPPALTHYHLCSKCVSFVLLATTTDGVDLKSFYFHNIKAFIKDYLQIISLHAGLPCEVRRAQNGGAPHLLKTTVVDLI